MSGNQEEAKKFIVVYNKEELAMSVLYLKSELNCGLGAINGEDASKAGGHGSQRARSQ